MGFIQDVGSGVGSFLGNIFGINQSAGADKFRDIGTSNLGQGATNVANAATTYNNTVDGVIFGNDSNTWQYSFVNQAGPTVFPLTWQSTYLRATGVREERQQARKCYPASACDICGTPM